MLICKCNFCTSPDQEPANRALSPPSQSFNEHPVGRGVNATVHRTEHVYAKSSPLLDTRAVLSPNPPVSPRVPDLFMPLLPSSPIDIPRPPVAPVPLASSPDSHSTDVPTNEVFLHHTLSPRPFGHFEPHVFEPTARSGVLSSTNLPQQTSDPLSSSGSNVAQNNNNSESNTSFSNHAVASMTNNPQSTQENPSVVNEPQPPQTFLMKIDFERMLAEDQASRERSQQFINPQGNSIWSILLSMKPSNPANSNTPTAGKTQIMGRFEVIDD